MKIISRAKRQLTYTFFAVSIASVLSAVTPAHAAKFGVRVVDDNDRPIAGAAVCIGLQGNYKQFAAQFTDSEGRVMVDVPNVPLLLTVSKDRFTGTRSIEPARSFNLLKEVKLREGIPGPRCRAGSALAESAPSVPSIVVSDIAIKEGVYSTTLEPTVTGEPSHYRVSDNKSFDGARWQAFSSKIALAGNLSDSDKIYLQLRKRMGTSTAYLESHSDVLTIRLN